MRTQKHHAVHEIQKQHKSQIISLKRDLSAKTIAFCEYAMQEKNGTEKRIC